jgi:murein L,D-transpeptidase YcbB/YkuD
MLPNPFNVYLHDTPSDGLFARTGRSFSHGCVRIEDPVGFAGYVLRDQPAWSRTAIQEAMHAGDEKHVKLTRQVPVHLLYFTAWTDELGGLHFRDDVYGFDRRQAAAMPRRGKSGPDGRAESARGPVVVGKARAGM